jgi:hypothetical protein
MVLIANILALSIRGVLWVAIGILSLIIWLGEDG